MRSYVISCEFYRGKKGQAALTDQIRFIASEWEQPHAGTWIVRTEKAASEIRTALLPHLDFNDRIFICEAGEDRAGFNVLPASGVKVTSIDIARDKSRLLARIFSRDGTNSRHLRAATSRSLRSA